MYEEGVKGGDSEDWREILFMNFGNLSIVQFSSLV